MANKGDINRAKYGKNHWNAWAEEEKEKLWVDRAIVDFSGFTFPDMSFSGFVFPGRTDFKGATFKGVADFKNATFEDEASFEGVTFKNGGSFVGTKFGNRANFKDATFENWANFNNATFKDRTNFTDTYFKKAPLFHNAAIHQDTAFSFGGDFFHKFPDIKSNYAERAYRTLKLAMNKYQAHTEEAGFFKLELKARAKKEKWHRKWMYGAYDLFSDYGQSVSWPLFWWLYLALIAFAFHSGIAIALHGVMATGGSNAPFTVTAAQAIPFIGAEKKAYYGALKVLFPPNGNTPIWFQITRALHMVASSFFIFLALLALRNRFKIK